MSGLREAFEAIAADVPVYGDLDLAIEQANRERRRRSGMIAGVAAAAVVAVIVGVFAVTRDGNDSPQPVGPVPTQKETSFDPLLRNGQITGAQRHFGVRAAHYSWRSFDPVSDTGLFITPGGPDRDDSVQMKGPTVVGPAGPVATLTCARDLQCSPTDNPVSYVATLGPGVDELTVISGYGTAQVIGHDGTLHGTIDLTATNTDGESMLGLRWSPDGSRLAVVTSQDEGDAYLTRVWLVDRGGEAHLAYSLRRDLTEPFTRAGSDFDGAGTIWTASGWGWSPDGRTLLLDVDVHAGNRSPTGADVVLLHVPPDGAADPVIAQKLFHSDRHFDWAGNVAWSPDGTRIAVRTGGSVVEISAEDGSVLAQHPPIDDWLIWPAREGQS